MSADPWCSINFLVKFMEDFSLDFSPRDLQMAHLKISQGFCFSGEEFFSSSSSHLIISVTWAQHGRKRLQFSPFCLQTFIVFIPYFNLHSPSHPPLYLVSPTLKAFWFNFYKKELGVGNCLAVIDPGESAGGSKCFKFRVSINS